MGNERAERSDMSRYSRLAVALASLTLVLAGARTAPQSQAKSTIDAIRTELMQLPYYGVFDFLAFKYDKGTATLLGHAYRPVLKTDAVRAVKRVSGVDDVVDKIDELPVSQNDDELRWKTYYAIYRDPFLSRYAPGGGMLWGHRHAFGPGLHPLGAGPFLGFEPIGDYPIHIIVKSGKITLLGVVDNESDKTVAGMKVREVPASFGAGNQLMGE